jgi:arabinoxylan arabinofuranohydrolase
MKHIFRKVAFSCALYMGVVCVIQGQNPIIQHTYTADPAPLVHGDTLYLFTGHDEDNATTRSFIMYDYLCFSTVDMVNWTAHAPLFDIRSLSRSGNANAAQTIFRNGKFYNYISPNGIPVLVSDNPYGPYKDALNGKLLISPEMTNYKGHGWEDIDPTVFIDDDDQAYMYWGNNALYCVKLNKDMISFSGDIVTFEIKDKEAFGSDYEEAPWIFKRNGMYYLMYAAHVPENVYYATSSSPLGPWKYGGVVMKAMEQGCTGNHPGVAQYKGQWYFFYMNQDLPEGHDKRRAVNVIPFDFNPDGSITELKHSKAGIVKGVATLNPFNSTEAETVAWEEGIKVASDKNRKVYVTRIDDKDYIRVRDVDFAKGAKYFEARIANAGVNGVIELHVDAVAGPLIGQCKVNKTATENIWETVKSKVSKVKGVHDLYFVFKGQGGNLFDFDCWKFVK